MSNKLSQLEKAIANFDHEIAVLAAARQKLVEQQAKQPKRKQAPKNDPLARVDGEPSFDIGVDHVDPRD